MLMCVCVPACPFCVCGKQQYVILLVRHKKVTCLLKMTEGKYDVILVVGVV